MDSLDVNDTCKRPITNLKGHFVYGEIIQMHTIHESNCTVIKQSRNGNSEAKINQQKVISYIEDIMHK